jgi:Flp pilus assembly protein CpaB
MELRWLQPRRRREGPEGAPAGGLLDLEPPRVRLRPSGNGKAPTRGRTLLRPIPLVGVALVLIALIGYLSVYLHTTARTGVLVAAHPLQAGRVLRPSDLRKGGLSSDPLTLSSLVPVRQLPIVVGRRLQAPLAAGAPLERSALAAPASEPATFTLSVPFQHALAGSLHQGDRVTVLATFTAGNGRATSRAVARDLEVVGVSTPTGSLDRSTATVAVTVALPNPGLATALALANEAGKIDLLREGTHSASAAIPTVSGSAGP